MAQAAVVEVGGELVGAAHPPHLLADLDVYFKRDQAQAKSLIDAIAVGGCRFLKGAVLSRPELCLRSNELYSYFDPSIGGMIQELYHEVIARHLVPLESLAELLNHGRSKGLLPILSVYDDEGVAFACEHGAVAIKIPSSNIVHGPLIDTAVRTGLPILIDTGRSTLAEIDRAVAWALEAGARGRLIVEHSPPGPPAGASRAHLRMLSFFAERYECPVGLSDHAIGLDMLPLAVALGAGIIEKGIVHNDCTVDIDVAHALQRSELPQAIKVCRQAWEALGKAPRPETELPMKSVDRMGLVALHNLDPGEVIGPETATFAFPPLGIPVEHWSRVHGLRLIRSVASGEPITWDTLEVDCWRGTI